MPRRIDRSGVQELIAAGTPVVSVLPHNEYEDDHLPDAMSIPLREIDARISERIDPSSAVIVYCWDSA